MSTLPDHFKLTFKPVATADAVIQTGFARFTVLTDRLLRLEYHPQKCFEDRPSQTFWFREQPVPAFGVQETPKVLEIETEYLHLVYHKTLAEGFTSQNLAITLKATQTTWHPDDPTTDNLLGTTRTLDFANGYTPLTTGLMSRAGWSVLDDSKTLVFNQDYWLEPRPAGGTDWYFFGYGHAYKICLQDYSRISGPAPLIPRWILGNWWSRYWHYTQDELIQLIEDFKTYELPFSVCIVDMDWHLTKTGNTSSGWTGYTWNRELFPDPQGLIEYFHQQGLRTALNLHPAEGIHPHEEQYPEMARRLGIDPASQTPIQFDITDPEFVKAYFEVLHHPYEKMGVDFWWVDWQQGLSSKLPGLDPLWFINHLHFYDLGRDGVRRPFIFSRWGNEGHQRYPIGFSGDSYRTWETLNFQSYMTATASNIAYGWWSHDIGGHTSGVADSELFTRWVQFATFSPMMRLHVGKGVFYDQRPWAFEDAEVLKVLREALQLRHALIPYLYTMAHRAHAESLPLIQPMYYDYPEDEAAYHCPHQYLFGTELIAAPYVTPADPDTQLSRQVVWLPEGDWYNFFTGEHFNGNRWYSQYGRLQDIPIFAKAGAIIPLGPQAGWGGVDNPNELQLHVFAGADHQFTLYEDDGETQSTAHCSTTFIQQWSPNRLEVIIQPASGDTSLIPDQRTYQVYLHGLDASAQFAVEVDGQEASITSQYDDATETWQLSGMVAGYGTQVRVVAQSESLLSHRSRKREKLLHMLKFFKLHVGIRNRIADEIDAILADPILLAPYLITMTPSQSAALFELLYEAGIHSTTDTHHPTSIVVWNNHANPNITYRYSHAYLYFGFLQESHHEKGVLPAFKSIIPTVKVWQQGALQEHVHRTQWQVQLDYDNVLSVKAEYRENTP